MKFQAVLSVTTTDMIKSKMLSPELAQIVFDAYMTPEAFAELVRLHGTELSVEVAKQTAASA